MTFHVTNRLVNKQFSIIFLRWLKPFRGRNAWMRPSAQMFNPRAPNAFIYSLKNNPTKTRWKLPKGPAGTLRTHMQRGCVPYTHGSFHHVKQLCTNVTNQLEYMWDQRRRYRSSRKSSCHCAEGRRPNNITLIGRSVVSCSRSLPLGCVCVLCVCVFLQSNGAQN
jgi:hypothetical protein